MLQTVPKTPDGLDDPNSEPAPTPEPRTLAERLDAEFPIGAKLATKVEPTASCMAERFAPQPLRATREEPPLANDAGEMPAPAPAPRLFSASRQGVLAVLTGVAIAPAAILAGLLWFGAIRGPEIGAGTDARPTNHQAAIAGAPTLRVTPPPRAISLTAPEEIMAAGGDEVAFTIAIDTAGPLPARAVIAVRELPEGAAFSQGRPFGAREWSLVPDEITGLALRLPEDHSGSSDLAVELVAADGTVLARTATRLDVAPAPTAGLVVRTGEEDRVDDLIAHGHKMIAVGYFAGARAYYQRAAEAGSGDAALAAGATYDPAFIAALRVQGIKPDREAAETWYTRAAALGVADRARALQSLKEAWMTAPEAAHEETPQPAATPVAKPAARPKAPADAEPGSLGRLVAAASELASGEEWVEVASPVNVRKGPSSSDATFKVAQKGTKLRVLGRSGNWVQISDPATKQDGWIYKRFLKETEAP